MKLYAFLWSVSFVSGPAKKEGGGVREECWENSKFPKEEIGSDVS
jgi:hypothetical protein